MIRADTIATAVPFDTQRFANYAAALDAELTGPNAKGVPANSPGLPKRAVSESGLPWVSAPRIPHPKAEPQRGSSLAAQDHAARSTSRLQPTLGLPLQLRSSFHAQPRVAPARPRLIVATLGYTLQHPWRNDSERRPTLCSITQRSAFGLKPRTTLLITAHLSN